MKLRTGKFLKQRNVKKYFGKFLTALGPPKTTFVDDEKGFQHFLNKLLKTRSPARIFMNFHEIAPGIASYCNFPNQAQ